MILLRGIAVWLIFILAESINGTIRTFWLVPWLGDDRADQIGFITGSLLVLAIAFLLTPWLRAWRISQLLGVGLLWAVLTLGFEIALGRFGLGYSWTQIAADYNIRQGGLMPFGLLLLALAPLIAAKLRGSIASARQAGTSTP